MMPDGKCHGLQGAGCRIEFVGEKPVQDEIPAPVKRLAEAQVVKDEADAEYWAAREDHDKYMRGLVQKAGSGA